MLQEYYQLFLRPRSSDKGWGGFMGDPKFDCTRTEYYIVVIKVISSPKKKKRVLSIMAMIFDISHGV